MEGEMTNSYCYKCGRKIDNNDKDSIDGKIYCESCKGKIEQGEIRIMDEIPMTRGAEIPKEPEK